MKNFTSAKLFFIIICLSIFIPVAIAETIHQWEVKTISFKSGKTYSNPYKDIPAIAGGDLLTVAFEGTGGDALNKKITIVGFWKGGLEWCVNFTSPFTGSWNYTTSSADRSMNGKKGSFDVVAWNNEEKSANPVRHGLIRVKKDGENGGHFFEYSDGQPVLWIGDTWWNWTNRKIKFETFRQLVDDRSAKGFNVGQLFIPGNGWAVKVLCWMKLILYWIPNI